jgi:hypothetical protein
MPMGTVKSAQGVCLVDSLSAHGAFQTAHGEGYVTAFKVPWTMVKCPWGVEKGSCGTSHGTVKYAHGVEYETNYRVPWTYMTCLWDRVSDI